MNPPEEENPPTGPEDESGATPEDNESDLKRYLDINDLKRMLPEEQKSYLRNEHGDNLKGMNWYYDDDPLYHRREEAIQAGGGDFLDELRRLSVRSEAEFYFRALQQDSGDAFETGFGGKTVEEIEYLINLKQFRFEFQCAITPYHRGNVD